MTNTVTQPKIEEVYAAASPIDAVVFDVSTVIRLKNAVIHREVAKDESLLK